MPEICFNVAMSERAYCSEANGDEPMLGTADVVDVWLLLEYRPAWKAKAVTDNDLSTGVRRWLAAGMEALGEQGLKVRPQLIRQPEIDRPDTRLLIYHDGLLREFGSGAVGYDDLLGTPIDTLVADKSLGTVIDAPNYFVCTNGQRDLCCARFGLPAYAKLRELVGERVWQTTHLGGHRFAPNVLVLPPGVLYGRVAPQAVATFVAEVEAGGIPTTLLRGRACFPKPVQAAEGHPGCAGLELLHVEGDEVRATATFADAGKTVTVAVHRSAEPLWVKASCGDREAKAVYSYVVEMA